VPFTVFGRRVMVTLHFTTSSRPYHSLCGRQLASIPEEEIAISSYSLQHDPVGKHEQLCAACALLSLDDQCPII
jgi:hypothetical protein